MTFDLFDQFQIRHGIFMRHGGVSPAPWKSLNMATSVGDSKDNVTENRYRISSTMSIGNDSFFDVWQIHSDQVVTAEYPRLPGDPHVKADAIVTDNFGVALLMLFADCAPVFFFDNVRKVAAMAHAGWQGTAKKIIQKTIDRMVEEYRCQPHNIIAGIGPTISVNHYEIGDDVIKEFCQLGWDYNDIFINRESSVYLDLQKANRSLIQQSGISQIEDMKICTASHTEDWFSHRGENGLTGRFAAVLSI